MAMGCPKTILAQLKTERWVQLPKQLVPDISQQASEDPSTQLSEPILLPKLRIHLADFPYSPYSKD